MSCVAYCDGPLFPHLRAWAPRKTQRRIVRQSLDANHKSVTGASSNLNEEMWGINLDGSTAQLHRCRLMLAVGAHLDDQPPRSGPGIDKHYGHAVSLDFLDERGNVLRQTRAATIGIEEAHLAAKHITGAV